MRLILTILAVFISITLFAQKSAITGVVKDKNTGETLVGANIVFTDNVSRGTIANIDGEFKLPVDPGTYSISISYVGYKKEVRTVKVGNKPAYIEVELKSEMLDEVEVVADIAIDRKTPVAHINIKPAKIEEELSGRDLPMILNSTPGVYATAGGGGEGDAEVRIRGFKGNFVGVLLDGIPVNDMENGWVYWSNWFGLSTIMRNMDVQRGLGASKLAIPSIGGTINILTKGIENKEEFKYTEEIDNFGKRQRNAGYNSGLLENGWSFTVAASHKKGSGWVEKTDFEGIFYFAKINKRYKKHLFSVTAFGAPQWHEQRSYASRIATYDAEYAEKLGVDLDDPNQLPQIIAGNNPGVDENIALLDKGLDYNSNWGWLRRHRNNPIADREAVHTAVNEYYKPMFYLKDFWTINSKMSLSNIAYLSLGRGGGVSGVSEQDGSGVTLRYNSDGQINLQSYYDNNTTVTEGPFGDIPPTDTDYHPTKYRSDFVIPRNVNEHFWVGYLSTLNYKMSSRLTHNAGIDLRHYEGTHYREVFDLLGGDYYIDATKPNDSTLLGVGGKFYFHDVATVSWGGLFYQAEYSTPVFTALINLTGNISSFQKHDLLEDQKSARKTLYGWTVKGGVNYNLTEDMNIFANAGYYDKVQGSKYVYSGYSIEFSGIENEKIKSVEIGTMYKTGKLRASVNGYLTYWENRPSNINPPPDANAYSAVVGLDARHTGVELDLTYDPIKQLSFESWVSVGDWVWQSQIDNITFEPREEGQTIEPVDLNIKGLHVSDAAQTQLGFSVNFKPIKGMYLKVKTTYFDRYYADFSLDNPETEGGTVEDSWQIPEYQVFDFHGGYRFSVKGIEQIKFKIGLNILNFTDEKYIYSARNNDTYSTGGYSRMENDAASATAYFGAPRRILLKLGVRF